MFSISYFFSSEKETLNIKHETLNQSVCFVVWMMERVTVD
jgi:hypothetical protein